jgi:hypothetical protein
MKYAAVSVVIFLVCFAIAIPSLQAQGKCSMKTFAGSYVSFERGSSMTIDLTSTGVLSPAPNAIPSPPAWMAPGFVPFANIAVITYTPEGSGDGYYWMFEGSTAATLEPIPVHVTVTEMNEDCSGKFRYFRGDGAEIEERFILLENGRQYRSIPTLIKSPGIPTMSWIGSGQRIGRSSEPVNSCGPHTSNGSYLLACSNIQKTVLYPTKAVADSFLLRMDVSMSGDYTGLFYEKFGMTSIDERPAFGTVHVNPDCSFEATLNIQNITGSFEVRGAFVDEGKGLFAMGILNPSQQTQSVKYSFCQGTSIGQ